MISFRLNEEEKMRKYRQKTREQNLQRVINCTSNIMTVLTFKYYMQAQIIHIGNFSYKALSNAYFRIFDVLAWF